MKFVSVVSTTDFTHEIVEVMLFAVPHTKWYVPLYLLKFALFQVSKFIKDRCKGREGGVGGGLMLRYLQDHSFGGRLK